MTDSRMQAATGPFAGDLRAPAGARFAILASRWNPRITEALVDGARRAFADHGVAADAHQDSGSRDWRRRDHPPGRA